MYANIWIFFIVLKPGVYPISGYFKEYSPKMYRNSITDFNKAIFVYTSDKILVIKKYNFIIQYVTKLEICLGVVCIQN